MSVYCIETISYRFIRRGSLYKVIEEGVFEADVAKRVIREVLAGLIYIHDHGVIHRYKLILIFS